MTASATEAFAGPIAAAGKDVECIAFQDYGSTWRCVEAGIVAAARLVRKYSGMQRSEQPLSKLIFGVEYRRSALPGRVSEARAALRNW